MLRFLILVAVFVFVVAILYKVVKRLLMSINSELEDDDNLEDRAITLKREGDKFVEDLAAKQKRLKTELELIKRFERRKKL